MIRPLLHLDCDNFLLLQAFTFLYCLVTYIIFFLEHILKQEDANMQKIMH